MNRQKQLLAALLALLILSLIYAWNRSPRQQVATPRQPGKTGSNTDTRTTRANPKAAASAQIAYQPLAFPEPEQEKVTIKKDLFVPLHVIEAKIAAKKAAAIKPPPPPPPPPPPTPQELARKELTSYTSLGLLKKQGKVTAFLSKSGRIILVRVGDSIINGYKITQIQDDRLTMRADDGDEMSLGLR